MKKDDEKRTFEELKDYLKENLSIKVDEKQYGLGSYGEVSGAEVIVTLKLDGDIISEDSFTID